MPTAPKAIRIRTSSGWQDIAIAGPPGPGLPPGGAINQVLAKSSAADYATQWVAAGGVPDASPTVKGAVQLAGDLTGTAASPQIATDAVGAAEIAANAVGTSEIADSAVTSAKVSDGSLRAVDMRLCVACGWWYYASPPADTSNRFFSYAAQTYYDNGSALTGSAMVGADGIMYCRATGVYHISMAVIDNHGAVSGNYAGARLVQNGVNRYIVCGAHTAATSDTDGLAGGHGGASIIISLNNGDYMRLEAWSQAGFPLYMTQTWIQLPV